MKSFMFVALIILLASTIAHAKEVDRTAQVSKYFLTQANSDGTAINKILASVREESETGFCHGDCNLAKPVTAKDIQIVKTESNVYSGTYRGPYEASDKGSEKMTFEIFVPVLSVYYGGRIEDQSTLRFKCELEANEYQSPKAKIGCSEIQK